MIDLGVLDGGVRCRLEEPEWAGVVEAIGVEMPLGSAPLASAPVAEAEAGSGLDAAVRLVAGAPIVVNVLSGRPGLGGFLARIGTDGRNCACVVRVVGEGLRPTPGVEVSAFDAQRFAAEVVRLLPPPAQAWPRPTVLIDDASAKSTLAAGLTGDATMILERPGREPLALRLAVGTAGWVELGLRGDRVTHKALDPAELGGILDRQLRRAADRQAAYGS